MEDSKKLNEDQQDQNINELKFDILKIDSIIKKDSKYQEGDIIFQFCPEYKPESIEECDQKTDYLKYIAKIKMPSSQYLGFLSKLLKKENFGYNHFENGDEYFGQMNKDKKEGYGIYYYGENLASNSNIPSLIYVGEFKNNMKSGEGIYFQVNSFSEEEKEKNIQKKPLDFDLLIGNFLNDEFISGTVYNMKGGKRKIYKGKIKETKKNDEMGELYEDKDKIFFGVFKDNIMIEGRVIIMKDIKKDNAYYFKRKGNNFIDGEVVFDYLKWEEKDDSYIKKWNDINSIFDNEKIQELYGNIVEIRKEADYGNDLEYMKKINFDTDIKQKLKTQYGKFLYY